MQISRSKILSLSILMEGAAFIIALLLAAYFSISLLPVSLHPVRDIFIGTCGSVLPFVFFLFTVSEKSKKIPLIGSLRKTVTTDVKKIFMNAKLSDLAVISLLAGIAEEVLFRGVLQVKFGITAASIIFGLIHCVSVAYVIITIIMGFYIGLLYKLSGSLLVPIQLHFIYDLCALVYLIYFINEQ